MPQLEQPYHRILVATDFSSPAEAAVKQAVWLTRVCGAKLVLAHTLPDLRRAVHSVSYKAQMDLLYGDGELFQREARLKSDTQLRWMITHLNATDLDVKFETLLGEAFVEITHAVQQEGYDLVVVGSRGLATWKQFFIGSTAKRLIRKCPASVWVVKAEHVGPPQVVLASTDFSDVSRKAVLQGLWVAAQADAEFHLLHVIDSTDVPKEIIDRIPEGGSLRQELNQEAERCLQQFIESLGTAGSRVQSHLSFGTPWQEIDRMAEHLKVDLVVLGTVGRSGIQGVLLGNTAEKILDHCDSSILTVKPDGFVSPISRASWPLHPGPDSNVTSPPSQPGQ